VSLDWDEIVLDKHRSYDDPDERKTPFDRRMNELIDEPELLATDEPVEQVRDMLWQVIQLIDEESNDYELGTAIRSWLAQAMRHSAERA
jgi:hypothetical protein